MQPLAKNAGLVMVICDGHFPESGKKPFDNCTARAGRWFGARMAERMKTYMDAVLADTPDLVFSAAGQAAVRARIVTLVAELDEEFSRDQVDAIIRFACQEKFVQRGLITKKGAAVSAEQVAAHPYLAAPLPVGVPCDDGCTMVAAILLPTMLISVNVGDSRLTVLRAADLSTLYATMDQDMTVKARVDHIVAAQGSLLRKGGPQSNHRLVSFLPKAGERTDAGGLHYSHKVWSEARVALPEEWKEVCETHTHVRRFEMWCHFSLWFLRFSSRITGICHVSAATSWIELTPVPPVYTLCLPVPHSLFHRSICCPTASSR
jgi:hypothetical protein